MRTLINISAMRRLIVLLLTAMLLITYNASPQGLTEEQKKALMPKIQKILKDYEKYSQFSTDGMLIDQSYISQFTGLFAPAMKQKIYNDLALNKGSFVDNPFEYINFVKEFYPQGLDVKLDLDKMSIVEATIDKEGYTLVVKVSKKTAGIYTRQNIRRSTGDLYFYLSSPETNFIPTELKISGIINQDRFIALNEKVKRTGLYLGITGSFAKTRIFNSDVYSSESWTSSPGSNFSPTINLTLMFSEKFGISTGFKMSSYSTNFTLSDFNSTSTVALVDEDNDTYYPVFDINSLTEANTIKCYEIPIFLHLLIGKSKVQFYVNGGFVLSLLSDTYFTLDGGSTISGYYPQYNVTLSDIPEYGFKSYSFSSSDKINMKLPGTSLAAYGSFGVIIPAGKKALLSIGPCLNYGFTDLEYNKERHDNDFSFTMGNIGSTVLQSFGLEFGFSMKLF